MIFDAHSDFGLFVFKEHLRNNFGVLSQEHYSKLVAADVRVEVLTVGGDFSFWGIDFSKKDIVFQTISVVKKEIALSEGKYFLIESASDFTKLKTCSIGIILSIEGATPLLGPGNLLDEFYFEGVRSIILTTNSANPFSGGCGTPHIGLSENGRELLKQISDKPMILDLSHISERSFYEISDSYEKPFVVSHANVTSICNHFRNCTDEQLIRLAEHDGVLGMSLVSVFIEDNPVTRTTLDELARHFDYVSKLIGTRHSGIGPDFMDYMQDTLSEYIVLHKFPVTSFSHPQGIDSVEDLGKIAHLLEKKFNQKETDDILYGNFERVYKCVLNY